MNELAKSAIDKIPNEKNNAKEITRIIKKNNKVVGYELANEIEVDKEDAIRMAEDGLIKNVGIAHRGNTKYLKTIPDSNEFNNLDNLPTKSSA